MDCVKWKNILLQWVKNTDLLENKDVDHLEQINIYTFYQGFRKQLHMKDDTLEQFVKAQFPDCYIKFDESGSTAPPNFMYIVSIFLYYSCIKNTDNFFQTCCNKLDVQNQSIIATFFRQLVDHGSLTEKIIRAAIHQAIPLMLPPFMSIDSPVKTPKSKQSPPTPTTLLLDEKKRENKLLQSQLDSERYERGFLEVQLKQNEEKITKLVKDHKKQMLEIQGLKSELLNQNVENMSPNRSIKEEQTKKRLRKQIAEKDEEIQRLGLELENAEDDGKNIKEKLLYSQQHLKDLTNKAKELEDDNESLKKEVVAKSEMISCLLENNMELQTYVQEMRKGNAAKLNTSSIECLDQSFSLQSANTTGSNLSGSSENLGRSVIDLMLKESQNKVRDLELEVIQIQESLAQMQQKNQLLCSENSIITAEYEKVSMELKTILDNVATLDNEKQTLQSSIVKLETDMKSASNESEVEMKGMKEQISEKCKALSELQEKFDGLQAEMKALQKSKQFQEEELHNLTTLNESQVDLCAQQEQELIELQLQLSTREKELAVEKATLSQCQVKLVTARNETQLLKAEVQNLNTLSDESEKVWTAQVFKLTQICERNIEEIERLEFEKLEAQTELETEKKALEVVTNDFEQLSRESEEHLAKCQEKESMAAQIFTVKVEECIKLETELNALIEVHESTVLKLNKDIEMNKKMKATAELEFHKQLTTAVKFSDDMQQEVDQKTRQIQDLEAQVQETTELLTEYMEKLNEIEAMNSILKASAHETENQLQDKIVEYETIVEELQEEHRVNEELKKESLELSANVENLEADTKLKQEQLVTLLNEDKTKSLELLSAKTELEAQVAGLQEQITTKDTRIMDLEAAVSNEKDKVSEITTSKVDLETQVDSVRKEIAVIEATVQQLKAEKGRVEAQFAVANTKISELSDSKGDLESKILNLQEIVTTKEACFEAQLAENLESFNNAKTLQEQLTSVNTETIIAKKDLEVQVADLLAKIEKLEVEVSLEKEHDSENLIAKKELENQVSSLHETLSVKQTETEKLMAENARFEVQLTEIRENFESAETHQEQLTDVNTDLLTTKKELEGQVADLQAKIVKLEAEISVEKDHSSEHLIAKTELENQVINLQETLDVKHAETEKLKAEKTRFKVQLTETSENLESAKTHQEQLTSDLLIGKKDLEGQVAGLQAKIAKLEAEISVEKEHSSKHLIAKTELENQVVNLQDTVIEELKVEKVRFETQLAETHTSLDVAKTSQEQLLAELDIVKADKDALESQIASLHVEVQTKEIEIENLKTEKERSESEISSLRIREGELTKNSDELETEIHKLKVEQKVNQTTNSEENDALKKQIEILKINQQEAGGELQTALNKCQEFLEEITNSGTKIAELKNELETEKQTLTSETSKFNADRDLITEQLNQKDAELQQKDSEVEKTRLQLEKKVEELTVEYRNRLEMELKKVEDAKNEELTTQSETYQQQIQNFIHEREEIENEIHQIEREILTKNDSVCEKMSSGTRQPQLAEQLNTIKQQIHNLNLEKSKFICSVTDLDRKLESASNENYKLQNKCVQLQESYEEVTQAHREQAQLVNKLQTMLHDSETNHGMLKRNIEKTESIVDKLKSEVLAANILKTDFELLKVEHNRMENTLLEAELKISVQNEITVRLEAQVDNTVRSQTGETSRIQELSKQLEKLKLDGNKIDELELLHKQEKEFNEKLQGDINIFQAKLYKQRQLSEKQEKDFADERKLLQDKIAEVERVSLVQQKDIRLEMEGKLEKMKEKMKTLYNDEMSKAKAKHEKEIIELHAETQSAINKALKYELHAERLNKQLTQVEQQNIELKRQYEYVKNKLHFLEENAGSGNRMLPPATTVAAPNMAMGSNLRMEDEEGECFNNTYLTDLKVGRMPGLSDRESMRLSELQLRNSMQLPHMRSTYAPQYLDPEVSEDIIKNGPLNDDSMSSLLPTGVRKKVSGTTSYKRPGPPTPSKNGGRLSFGGANDNQYREILKEQNDPNMDVKKPTPGKSRFFSRFANKTDENRTSNTASSHTTLSSYDVTTPLQSSKKLKSLRKPGSTSTPKSKNARQKFLQKFDSNRRLSFSFDENANAPKSPEVRTMDLWRDPQNGWSSSSSETSSILNGKAETTVRRSSAFGRELFFNTMSTIENTSVQCRKSILQREATTTGFLRRRNVLSKSPAEARVLWRKRAKEQRRITFNKYRSTMLYPNDGLIATPLFSGCIIKKSLLHFSDDPAVSPTLKDFGARDSLTIARYHTTPSQQELFEKLLNERLNQDPFVVDALSPALIATNTSQTKEKIIYTDNMVINRRIPYFDRVSNIFQAQQLQERQSRKGLNVDSQPRMTAMIKFFIISGLLLILTVVAITTLIWK